MTEMQFTDVDEAYEFLREQLVLATKLTNNLMDRVEHLRPDKFVYVRNPGASAGPNRPGGRDDKAARRPILRVIEGGLGKANSSLRT